MKAGDPMTLATRPNRAVTRARPHRRTDLASAKPPTADKGTSGGVAWGGVLAPSSADYAAAWHPPRRWQTIENMRADPAVSAVLAAITYPILSASLEVEPASNAPEDVGRAEFIAEGLENMTVSEAAFRMEALDSVGDGVSVFYTRYEKREDGLWWLRKPKLLPNKSIIEWNADEATGDPTGITQLRPDGRLEFIPIEELLIFSHGRRGGTLWGRPVLRTMYRPWYAIDKATRIGLIAIERTGVGIPWARYTGGGVAEAAALDDALMGLHAHEQAFIRVDEDTPDLGFLAVSGSTVDAVPMMEYQRRDLFLAALAQFLALGADATGAFALSKDHSSFFLMALRFIATEFEDTINRYLIPRWIGYNWTVAADRLPKVKHGAIDQRSALDWANAVAAILGAGVQLPADELSKGAAELLGLTLPEVVEPSAAGPVSDVNDPNAPDVGADGEIEQRAGAWPGATFGVGVCEVHGGVITLAGRPCGASFIAPGKECRIGGARSFTDPGDFGDYFAEQGATKASASQRKAIEAYGAEGYQTVNASLRGGKKPSAKDAKTIAEMDAYMASAKPLSEDIVTFRGGQLPAGIKVGGEFSDAGFGSTSGDFDKAQNFARGGNVMIQVRIPKGSKVAPFGAAMGDARSDFESEVIVPRGSRYRVTGQTKMKRKVTYRKFPSGTGTKTVTVPVVEVELIP